MILFNYISENLERVKTETKMGITPCSLLYHWEIYAKYDILKKMGNSETMSRFTAAECFRVGESTMCRVIQKMEREVININV
jgi:hypothetical protein